MIIYKITNLVNGKIYVGQTAYPLAVRWNAHVRYALAGGDGTRLAFAVRKYGRESFVVERIAEADSRDLLNELERKYIAELRSYLPEFGYNLAMGGSGGNPNKETREKISASRTGYKCSDEQRLAIASGHIGLTKDFCKRGHALAGNNLYLNAKTGVRQCKECVKLYYERRKRGETHGRHANKVHCVNGRELAVTGIYIRASGSRQCKACTIERLHKMRLKD